MNYTYTSSSSNGVSAPELPEILEVINQISYKVVEIKSQRYQIDSILTRLAPAPIEKGECAQPEEPRCLTVLETLTGINNSLALEVSKIYSAIDKFNKLV